MLIRIITIIAHIVARAIQAMTVAVEVLVAEAVAVIGKIDGKQVDLNECGRSFATLCRRNSNGEIIDVYVQFDKEKDLFYWSEARFAWVKCKHAPDRHKLSAYSPEHNNFIPQTPFVDQW